MKQWIGKKEIKYKKETDFITVNENHNSYSNFSFPNVLFYDMRILFQERLQRRRGRRT